MSSTSNIQNLLVNVFRPVYTYSNGAYVPKLNISNVDTVSARTLEVTTFGFGDSNGNIYIGSNSGGTSNNSANIAIGVSAATNAVSTSNSVFVGYGAGLGASNSANNIVIGYNASGAGNNNIYIGSNDGGGASSSNNIYIGNGLSNSGSVTNKFQVGFPGSILMTGDFSNKQLGINTTPSYSLDVCGDFRVTERYGIFSVSHASNLDFITNVQSTNPGSKALLYVTGDVSAQRLYGTVLGTIATSNIALSKGSASAPSYGFDVSDGASSNIAAGYGIFWANTGGQNRIGLATESNEVMSITSNGYIGIGCNIPSQKLEVNGTIKGTNFIGNSTSSNQIGGITLSNTNISYAGTLIGSTSNTSNQIGGITLNNNNLIASGYIRNDLTPNQFDISGGNMYLLSNLKAGTITVTGDVSSSGTFYGNYIATSLTSSNAIIPGYIRNALTPNTLDISGGNISNSATTTSSNFITSLTTTSNQIGGVTLSNTNLLANGYLRNANTGTLWDISSGNMYLSQRFDGSGIIVSNYIRDALTPSNWDISGGYMFLKTGLRFNSSLGSNHYIRFSNGGVNTATILYDGLYSVASFGMGYFPIVRDGVIPNKFDISDGNIYLSNNLKVGSITNSGDISGSSRIFTGSGSSIIPSYTFSSDTGSGMFSPASNQLAFSTGGTQRMIISNDLIGINKTTNSNYNLDILVNKNPGVIIRHATDAAALRLLGNGVTDVGTSGMVMYHASNDQGILTSNANPFIIWTNFVQRFTILNGGNVGIATTNPSYTLDVNGTTRSTNILANGYLRDALTPSNWDISGGNIRAFSNIITGAGTVSAPSHTFANDLSAGMYYTSSNQIGFTTFGVQRMCISGIYVGISCNAPTRALDVSGSAYFTTGNASVSVRDNSSTLSLDLYQSSNSMGLYTANSTLPFYIYTNNAQRLTILSNGNVGIATTTPSYTLDVNGTTRSTNILASGYLRNDLTPSNWDISGGNMFLSNKLSIGISGSSSVLDVVKQGTNVTSDLRIFAGANGGMSSNNIAALRFVTKGAGGGDVCNVIQMDLCGNGYGLTFLNSNANPYVRFDSTNSRVGINTLTPEYLLDVCGTSQIRASNTTALSSCLILSNANAGSNPDNLTAGNNYNESLQFTGNVRGWGIGVFTGGTAGSLGFMNYTQASGGPLSGTRYIRGFVQGSNGVNNLAFNFTGQHRCFIKNMSVTDLSNCEGLIVVSDNNTMMNMSGGLKRGKEAITINESLPILSLSSNVNDKRVFGVISTVEDPDNREDAFGAFVTPLEKQKGDTRAYVNAVGEGSIWVTNINGNIESGDYITSSFLKGYGQKQNEDVLKNYTVAKSTIDCDFTAPLQPKYIVLRDICGNNVLDNKGNLIWVEENDSSGNIVYETAYSMRYLSSEGIEVSPSQSVYKAAFIPCTYHCG